MFTFKFQKMLEIKEKFIQKKMINLVELNKVIGEKNISIKSLEEKRHHAVGKLDSLFRENVLDIRYVMLILEDINKINTQKESLKNDVVLLEKEKFKIIKELKDLNMEKKKLEKLKSYKYEVYMDYIKKEEMKFIDEINTIKYNKNGNY